MNRSPLFYPMHRGLDSDAGGAAELQTDVMRFMAILSLCLVAIFALVQSIPLVQQVAPGPPEEPTPQAAPERTVIAAPASPPKASAPRPPAETTGQQVSVAATPVTPPAATETRTQPVAATPTPPSPPATPPSPADPSDKAGFTLRFEDDFALTRLVETGAIGVYAIYDKSAMRLAIDADKPVFWPASLPRQFHEMDESTVPAAVSSALPASGRTSNGLRWGVTLPATMSVELNRYLAAHSGGDLVIDAGGKLRLE